MKKILFFFLVFGIMCSAKAQVHQCGSFCDIHAMQQQNPALYQELVRLRTYIDTSTNNGNRNRSPETDLIVIPVVFHILENPNQGVTIISNAQIISQLEALNRDFNKRSVDRDNIPVYFKSFEGDVKIEFRLACIDPLGNPTTGITRTTTNIAEFLPERDGQRFNEFPTRIKYSSQGGKDSWDTKKYLNIWVCNTGGSGVIGYATFPHEYPMYPSTDGIVIKSNAFGTISRFLGSLDYSFNKGHTGTHEAGHWLGLWHLTGPSACGDDEVSDTPPQPVLSPFLSSFTPCPSVIVDIPTNNTCGMNNAPNGRMFMSFMDYGNDDCKNMFSKGQATRMRGFLAATGSQNRLFWGTLPTNTHTTFIYGGNFKDLRNFTVRNNGVLQVNGVGGSEFGGSGAPMDGSPVTITPMCQGSAKVTIEQGG